MSDNSPLPERDDLHEPATRGDLIKLFKYMKKWKKDMRQYTREDIKKGVERHELRCPSLQKTELKRTGVIKDSGDYIKQHPFISTGVLSSIFITLLELVRKLIL